MCLTSRSTGIGRRAFVRLSLNSDRIKAMMESSFLLLSASEFTRSISFGFFLTRLSSSVSLSGSASLSDSEGSAIGPGAYKTLNASYS